MKNTYYKTTGKKKIPLRYSAGGSLNNNYNIGYSYINPNTINTDFDIGTVATDTISGAAAGTAVLPGWGTLAGAVVGLGTGLYDAATGQSDALEQRDKIIAENKRSKAIYDRNRMSTYNSNGYEYNSLYSKGGKISYAKGGELSPFEKAFYRSRKKRLKGGSETFTYKGKLYHDYTANELKKGIEPKTIRIKYKNKYYGNPNKKVKNAKTTDLKTKNAEVLNTPNELNTEVLNNSNPAINQEQSFNSDSYNPLEGSSNYWNPTVRQKPNIYATEPYQVDNLTNLNKDKRTIGQLSILGNQVNKLIQTPFKAVTNNPFKKEYYSNLKNTLLIPNQEVNDKLLGNINQRDFQNITEAAMNIYLLGNASIIDEGIKTALGKAGKYIGSKIPVSKIARINKLKQAFVDAYGKNSFKYKQLSKEIDKIGLEDFSKTKDYGRVSTKNGRILSVGSTPIDDIPISTTSINPNPIDYNQIESYSKGLSPLKIGNPFAKNVSINPIAQPVPTLEIPSTNIGNYYKYFNEHIGNGNFDEWLKSISSNPKAKLFIDDQISKGFSKGGTISNIKTNANKTRIGTGIQVTGNPSKDAINAEVSGIPVKLDNKEIIVKYNGKPVVISDDLGEADKYRKMIASGYNPKEVSNLFAKRAIKLNPRGGSKLAFGGYGNNNSWLGYNNQDGFNINTPDINMYKSYMSGINSKQSISTMPKLNYDSSLTMPEIKPTTINDFNSSNYKSINDNLGNTLGQGLTMVANTLGNINASNKLKRLSYPGAVTTKYTPPNFDANTPIYEQRISETIAQNKPMRDMILSNSGNSGIALSRLQQLRSNEQNAINKIRAEQTSNRDRLINWGNVQQNRINMYNTNTLNRNNLGRYGDEVNRINTDLNLQGSTLAGINGIINNLQKQKYDAQTVEAIGRMYGVDFSRTNTIEDKYKLLMQSLQQQLLAQQG